MQEVGPVALADQFDMGGKTLEHGACHQLVETRDIHAAKERQDLNVVDVCRAHPFQPPTASFSMSRVDRSSVVILP